MQRRLRQILTNKWVICLYPILFTIMFISYVHCKYYSSPMIQNNPNERKKRTTNSAAGIETKSIECYLFLFIMTSPSGLTRRKAMRETWLNSQHKNGLSIKWRFVIGTKDLSIITLKELQNEQNQYSDLLFLNDHKDSYNVLTSKLLNNNVTNPFNCLIC